MAERKGSKEDSHLTHQKHYRYWVIWRCPSVRFLDYAVVKLAERKQAIELFGTATEPTDLASKVWFRSRRYFIARSPNTQNRSSTSNLVHLTCPQPHPSSVIRKWVPQMALR